MEDVDRLASEINQLGDQLRVLIVMLSDGQEENMRTLLVTLCAMAQLSGSYIGTLTAVSPLVGQRCCDQFVEVFEHFAGRLQDATTQYLLAGMPGMR